MMDELAGFGELSALPGYEEATPDLADAVLDEAAKFAGEVLAPLNRIGDTQGCQLGPNGVTTPAGWKEAYAQFAEAGWNGITCPPDFGGQGLPSTLGIAVQEMVCSANLAFSLGPLLTSGAVEALLTCASDELKATFLEKMISGQWTGTMNLTEPHAGSDLALLRSKAEPQADGTYRVFGQKIFITYGDHDMTENIVHLVLARLPDAPPGVKGISLFLVPKFLVNADGSLGERNDAYCVSIEHKLGIHASPTCVMAYGDNGGAVGYLLGQANRGLEYMFIMMNAAPSGCRPPGHLPGRALLPAGPGLRPGPQAGPRRPDRRSPGDHRQASGHPAHADAHEEPGGSLPGPGLPDLRSARPGP